MKTRAKNVKSRILIDCVDDDLQSAVTYIYIYRQHDTALWVGYDQIIPKQMKSETLLRLYLCWENWIVRFRKPDDSVL
jgi:hypothetical protein